jgi:hypothetical protein
VADNPFGDMLRRLADVIGGARGGGAGGIATGGSHEGIDFDLLNPALGRLTPEQLHEIFFQMSDNARDMYLRQLLKIPSVTEQQRVLDPDLDINSPRFQIQRLFPVSPSQMPMIRPGAAPPAWSWPL